MRLVSFDDYFALDADGNFASQPVQTLSSSGSYSLGLAVPSSLIYDGQTPTTTPGALDGSEGLGDAIVVNLTAGVTYSFTMRPTLADGIEDPFLSLFNGAGTVLIAQDDDGGLGRSSLLTFTPTESGSYILRAGSWVNIFSTGGDVGSYTIDQWDSTGPDATPNNPATALSISVGTPTFGHLGLGTDTADLYQISLTAGLYYEFDVAGGVATNAERGQPGELLAQINIFDSNLNLVAQGLNLESATGFVADQSGTFYVQIARFEGAGGYTLDVTETDLSTRDPLEAINWDTAANIPTVMVDGVPTAYVYFAPAGMHFGETADDGVSHMVTYGWTDREIQQVMLAFDEYSRITGINYEITGNPADATFRLMTTSSTQFGAYAYPAAPEFGSQAGIIVFNVDSGGWDKPGVSAQDIPGDQVSLDVGGFSFAVILHEIGHAHGLAHPHDTGGGSEIMPGVFGQQGPGTYGVFNLNQGVYTVMSYNDAWDFHPNGPSAFTIAGIDNGWSGTLGAFDIAAIQARYGTHAHNEGDTTYNLTDVVDDAYYQTIWDTGGTDSIAYGGSLDAVIDLTAATLNYSPTGGGAISFLNNSFPLAGNSFLVRGGYTIANGVVIENATGGSGNDVLVGNSADNVLDGGAGSDAAVYVHAEGAVNIDLVAGTATGGGGSDTLISIESAVGSRFNDTLLGTSADNMLDGGDGDDLMTAGDGIDTASYASVSAGVTVDLRIAGPQNTGGGGLDTLSGFENLTGSRFNDTLTGTDGDNVISGGGGNDVMHGLAGVDTLSYASASLGVSVNLLAGTATGGAGSDLFDGFENVIGTNFNDTITASNVDNFLNGSFGVDRLSYAGASAAVTVSLAIAAAQNTGGSGSDTILGFENLTGSSFGDTLTGTDGANDIIGGGGNDTITSGDGNDVVDGGSGNDALNAGNGVDTASYASATAGVTVSLAAAGAQNTVGAGLDTLGGFENLTGSNFNDTLTGDDFANVINGGVGNDTLSGGLGVDTLIGGTGNDLINGGGDNDTLNGDAGNDTLNGDAGIDLLNRGDGDDMLNGGVGNDRILGGAGIDTVTGGDGIDVVTLGGGNDVFKAEVTPTKVALKSGSMSVDIITDFDLGSDDKIDLSGLGAMTFVGNSSGNKAGQVSYKTYANVATAENVLGFDIDGQPGASGVSGPVTVVYGNLDGGAQDFAIVLLGTANVDSSDFIFA
jgi:Ca2+-binding RTX toxin-like protein